MYVTEVLTSMDAVSPCYCADLRSMGITAYVNQYWAINQAENSAVYKSYAFDDDDNMWNADQAIFAMSGTVLKPAYTIKDMEKCLPPYFISKHGDGSYEMSLESMYTIGTITEKRLPDVYAKMLLALLYTKKAAVKQVNRLISGK
jgi:hypothetical protein